MATSPSTCSWHLVTYLLGWVLASAGIGLMILISDPVSTNGNWLLFLVAGIACTALGGSLIVVAVSMPDKGKRTSWCCQLSHRQYNMCEKHEGVYISFPDSDSCDSSKTPLKPSNFLSVDYVRPPTIMVTSDYPVAKNGYDTSTMNSKNEAVIDSSWASSKGLTILRDDSLNYSETDERTAIIFYRETPV